MIGSRIANFQIVEELGSGGMGTVYKARDINLKRFVAVKVLNQNLLKKDNNYKRFKNEAEISAQMNHPNVATLFNFIEADNKAYIIMEYVDGKTLEALLDEKGALNKKQCVDITIQILKGLSAAHRLNILHRDLKPANIMIDKHGFVKIMDFGIALMENTTRLTTQNKVIGTIEYMAPELFSGSLPTTGSDLYAVGIMLFEMLTGKSLFQADSEASLMYQILHNNPKIDLKPAKKSLESVVSKLVHKNIKKRYEHTSDVIIDLEKKLAKDPVVSPIKLPDLNPVFLRIKNKLRSKTNFLKLDNVVKISNNPAPKFDLFKFVNKRLLIACLLLSTVIILIASFSKPKPSKQISKLEVDSGVSLYPNNSVQQNIYEPEPIVYLDPDPSHKNDLEIEKNNLSPSKSKKTKDSELETKKVVTESVEPVKKPTNSPDADKQPEEEIKRTTVPATPEIEEKTEKLSPPEPSPSQPKERVEKSKTESVSVMLREQKISLLFNQSISSKSSELGQICMLQTNENIIIDGHIVIAKNAPVKAVVRKKRAGNNGKVKFGIVFKEVQAVNGKWITLKYPEYTDIQKDEVIFEKGRIVNNVTVQSSRLNINI
ncbi:serine/threonine-protein kinase [Portibacter lacus]|uniref:Protein kinase domain-containing protein n=1 Tax=Portibacter lacus TaxID=1099794 RepID=A0AA37SQX7_9BACT|nr:serine/threonine-protein kinase [Portibacter lacus]GLR16070.1 hypothetical protein GCM10007940_06850 [Portibacter lacus]